MLKRKTGMRKGSRNTCECRRDGQIVCTSLTREKAIGIHLRNCVGNINRQSGSILDKQDVYISKKKTPGLCILIISRNL